MGPFTIDTYYWNIQSRGSRVIGNTLRPSPKSAQSGASAQHIGVLTTLFALERKSSSISSMVTAKLSDLSCPVRMFISCGWGGGELSSMGFRKCIDSLMGLCNRITTKLSVCVYRVPNNIRKNWRKKKKLYEIFLVGKFIEYWKINWIEKLGTFGPNF